MMGTMVDRVLKIPCKIKMDQSQGQKLRRAMKQCKDWYNPLGSSLSKTPTFKMGLNKEEPPLINVIQATKLGGIV